VIPRGRAALAAAFVAVHLLLFVPAIDSSSPLVERAFGADAEAIFDGAEPYRDLDFEYPPLALPLFLGPAAVADDAGEFNTVFASEMLLADLAIVVLLALYAPPERRLPALVVYSAGVLIVSGVGPLPDSAIEEAPLALARFDLVPAALVLGAALARAAARPATWGALLGLGTVVKAFPAALFPVFAPGEPRWRTALLAAAMPLAAAVVVVLALGDQFGSAVAYHSDRQLQVESLGASPMLLATLFGSDVATEFGSGSWNVTGGGEGPIRLASIVLALAAYAIVLRAAWTRRLPTAEAAVAALAPLVILAPVLSPQFLLWLLPLSGLAFGWRLPNAVLLAAFLLTAMVLNYYGGVERLDDRFVLAVLARNVLLLGYLALVLAPLVRGSREPAGAGPAPAPAS
jgi:Glycosyltransferase family 87